MSPYTTFYKIRMSRTCVCTRFSASKWYILPNQQFEAHTAMTFMNYMENWSCFTKALGICMLYRSLHR